MHTLAVHRYVLRLANALIAAFLWVFIFQYFAAFETIVHALIRTFLLYALMETITVLLLPFAMRRMRHGMLRGVIYGTIVLAAAFVFTGMLVDGSFVRGAAIVAILFGAYRALYRVPYSVESLRILKSPRWRLAPELVLALMPFVGTLAFMREGSADPFPASMLLFISATFAIIALIPLAGVRNVYEKFSWGYRETYGHLIDTRNHPLVMESIWKGILGAALFILWPISVFLLSHSYQVLGAGFSALLLIILLSRSAHPRIVVEQYADGNSYLDEYTALKEMGLSIGRLLLSLACASVLVIYSGI